MEFLAKGKKEHNNDNLKKLSIVIALNIAIVLGQIIFGVVANSLSLITDALHNLQDVISLIISLVAIIFMRKSPSLHMTFGYLRSPVFAAFINTSFLIGAIFVIFISSINRLLNPEPVESIYVIVVGFFAFVINGISAFVLKEHHHHEDNHHYHHNEDINIKSAYLHLVSDAGLSLAVVIGGIFIYLFNLYWIDPVISILFSLYIFKESIPIIKKSFYILMEGAPKHIDIDKIVRDIKNLPAVKDIHDVHIWALSDKDIYFSAHIILEDISISGFDEILSNIEKILSKEGINHITIQPESEKYKCEIYY